MLYIYVLGDEYWLIWVCFSWNISDKTNRDIQYRNSSLKVWIQSKQFTLGLFIWHFAGFSNLDFQYGMFLTFLAV